MDSDVGAYSDDSFEDEDAENEPDASPECAIDLLSNNGSSVELTGSFPSISSFGSPSSERTPTTSESDGNSLQHKPLSDIGLLIDAVRCSQEGMDVARRSSSSS